ncbi:MAG: M28 family peptidase [Gemmatimonadetes bacterium]|nr:M28 family peptidase [Gemmatimonadota bacterium]
MRSAGAAVLALVACVSSGCRAEGDRAQPAAAAAVAPPFDAQRAYELLAQQVGFGPRAPGSPGHARQLEWMLQHLRARADTVEVQAFRHATSRGDTLRLSNVFARFRPEIADRILLVAHWDTRPTADQESDPARQQQPILGANDGASGVAVLLELAHVLSDHSPPIGVDLLFADGEDYAPGEMFLGSEYFAANLPAGYRPLYAIVVDMVADQDPRYPVEGYSQQYAPEVVERVWRLAQELGQGAYFPRAAGGAIDDDHMSLNRAGIHAIDIIDFEYGPAHRYWHTLDDNLTHTAPAGLGVVGTVLAELIYRGG